MPRPKPAQDRIARIVHRPQTPFERLEQQYLQSMILRNCSERTIEYWALNLDKFNRWCDARAIDDVTEVTLEVLNAYRQHLFHYRNPDTNRPLKFSTQSCYRPALRSRRKLGAASMPAARVEQRRALGRRLSWQRNKNQCGAMDGAAHDAAGCLDGTDWVAMEADQHGQGSRVQS